MRLIEHLVGIRKRWFLLAAVVAGVISPATAAAANPPLYVLNTNSVGTTGGFKVHLNAYMVNPGYGAPIYTVFTVFLSKTNGHATQTATYVFSKGVKLSGSKNLGSGQITGATLLNGRGSINMSFHGTGSTSKAHVPGGCSGVAHQKRSGTLSGSLSFNADKLGKVTVSSVSATLTNASYQCSPPRVKGYLVEGSRGAASVLAQKRSASGPVTEKIQVIHQGNGWGFTYVYSVSNEPTADYKVGAKLSSATITGVGGIGGTANYSGGKSLSHSNGKLNGNLSVTMATLGLVQPFSGGKMSADQRHS